VKGHSKAYDWNRLRRERVVNDVIGETPVVVVLGADSLSYFAFLRPDAATRFDARGDSIVAGGHAYAMSGNGAVGKLEPINASQEFWHSWRTFQPKTERY
jgi:hypothetical protein